MASLWLLCVLFLPRISLLLTYLFGTMPANDTNFWVDAVGAICAPRLLVAYWGHSGGEMGKLWLVLMVVLGVGEVITVLRQVFGSSS